MLTIGEKKAIRLPYPHPGQQHVRAYARRVNWLAAGRRWRQTTLAVALTVEAAATGGTVTITTGIPDGDTGAARARCVRGGDGGRRLSPRSSPRTR